MADVKTWNIREIEGMTEKEAQEMASDKMNYKGYNVYFIDLGGYFMKFKIDIIGVVKPQYRVRGFNNGLLEIQYFFDTEKDAKQFIQEYKNHETR